MLDGKLTDTAKFQELANNAVISKEPVTDLTAFAQQYIDVFREVITGHLLLLRAL